MGDQDDYYPAGVPTELVREKSLNEKLSNSQVK